jgi:hypothetical protein
MQRATMLALGWLLAAALPAAAQSLLHLHEDFEAGLSGWTAGGLWHAAPAEQCGASSGMAAFNLPADCSCGSAGPVAGTLSSPAFTLVNPPFTIRFVHGLSMDPDDAASVRLVRLSDGAVYPLTSFAGNAALGTHAELIFSDAAWVGAPVRLEFEFEANGTGDVGFGWMLDDVEVRSGSWTNLGFALAGSQGPPLLVGSGPLAFGFNDQLSLFQAHPSSTAILVVGLSQLGAPFKGGTLVPAPQVLWVQPTNAVGVVHLAFFMPASTPPDVSLFFQYWIADPTAAAGWSASNALQGLTQ